MVTRDQLVAGLRARYGVSLEDAERAAARTMPVVVDARMPRNTIVLADDLGQRVGRTLSDAAIVSVFERQGDTLRLTINLAPRTKKNGTTLGIRQRASYRRYRDQIIDAIARLSPVINLPLPERTYNIAATYYVDRHGERADKCGLDQGLYDALENAGVVTNDWQFRTDDGTRIIAGDPRPRVELTITPLEEG